MPDPTATPLQQLLADHTAPAAAELVRDEGDAAVRCLACGHRCKVLPGRPGVCRVRFNRDGELRVPAGYVAGVAIDPIEKKPFFHALPGATALSFGMLGCDLHCSYCQNWITSQAVRDPQAHADYTPVTPAQLVRLAVEHHCPVLTSTYNEPLITAEWAVSVFRAGQPHGLVGSFVSNGNATPEVLAYLRPHVRLYKVDLKSFDDRTYRKLGCALENVCDTIRRAWQMGFWVEVVTLIVPGLNDGDDELRRIADFLASVSPDLPWHATAFHPDYKLTDPPRTPAATLARAREFGRAAGLRYVYAGNLPGEIPGGEDTLCPSCGAAVITRRGFRVLSNRLRDGHCPQCNAAIPGVWAVPVHGGTS